MRHFSPKLSRWLRRLAIAAIVIVGLLYWASRTEAPKLPPGVRQETQRFTLAGQRVAVTLYYPASRDEAPLVLVVHGFTRSKRYMAGWGAALAGQGFIAAVPTLPTLANHELNARALAELLDQLRHGQATLKVKPGARVALMGFSMGGLTTLLTAGLRPVDAWVGLDPVDMNGLGLKVAAKLRIPCAILRAEPEAWNRDGNARPLAAALPGPMSAVKVRGATHLDAESPTDLLGQLACGRVDPRQHAVFERYAIAFLKATIMDDPDSVRIVDEAQNDPALTEVERTPI